MVLSGSIHLPHLKSPRLQSFSFDNEDLTMSSLHNVTLCTPNLSYFKTNDYKSTNYSLQNISSIVIADISVTSVRKNDDAPELPLGVKELFAKRMIQFLRAVHNVKVLNLSYLSLEFASCVLEKLDTKLPRYQNLKCMKLGKSLSPDSLKAITYLLNLKSVKILGVQGLINELMLLELLLKSSVALEQVVVESCTPEQCRESDQDLSKRRMKKFSETLLKLQLSQPCLISTSE
ncbi:hypothetical protein MKX03_025954 [Papaver bracteatum]|nr:hypothetical protein MKX03_025954 [Papaver bracteatum]